MMKKSTRIAVSACMMGTLLALEVAPSIALDGASARAASVYTSAYTAIASQTAQRITGTVTALSKTSLTMRAEDGRTLTFAISGGTPVKAEGLSVGDAVDVFFVGSITGSSTAGTTVRSVEVVGATAGIVPSAQPVRVSAIAGTVTDATMNTIAIRIDDGRELHFGTADADKSRAEGLSIGDRVQIAYTGTIAGTSTSGVVVKSILVVDHAKAEHRITGVVTDATMNTLTIQTADGRKLSFGTADADKSKVQGLSVGDTVRVRFTGAIYGSSTAGATVTAVETVKNAPTINKIAGTITDATMNTLTIQVADGRKLSFATADADTSRAQGLLIGDAVTVYYTGTITTTVTKGATVLALVQEAPSPIAYAITGTIADATTNTITIRLKNGLTYSFGTADADKTKAKGLTIGSQATVCFTGEIVGTDTAGVTVVAVIQ